MRSIDAPQAASRKPQAASRKPQAATPDASLAPIPSEILDPIRAPGPLTPEELETAVRRFKTAIIERALGAELRHHLGYVPGGAKPEDTTNYRNGSRGKTVLTDDGPWALAVPRDRDGSFEPRLIGKHERRFTGFDDTSWRSMRAASRCARFRRFSPTFTASTSRPI